ncbi:hypothetical protein TNCV_4535021 [Trichonephila clavipes]|nr:hypothetical protein TNCV_4535021 [Trichonephila clavipes]
MKWAETDRGGRRTRDHRRMNRREMVRGIERYKSESPRERGYWILEGAVEKHLQRANRKTRSPLNSSLQKSFEMSRSKPRSFAQQPATTRPIAISGKILEQHTAVLGDKSFSPNGAKEETAFFKMASRDEKRQKNPVSKIDNKGNIK